MRVQRYDQCGEYIDGFDVQAGTFISREAYISIDSNDDVIALHSYSDFQSDISVCHVVKVNNNTKRNKQNHKEISEIRVLILPAGFFKHGGNSLGQCH